MFFSSFNRRSADDNYYLYHFTDARNLDSIRKNGLLSWNALDEKKLDYVSVADADSHKLDFERGWENYVRLSFCKYHPMGLKASKNSEILILKILPKIVIDCADTKGSVLVTNTNAVSKDPNFRYFTIVPYSYSTKFVGDTKHYLGGLSLPSPTSTEQEINNFIFNFNDEETLFDIPTSRSIKMNEWSNDLNSSYKKQQAEVLIKDRVPLDYIVNLADPELFPL